MTVIVTPTKGDDIVHHTAVRAEPYDDGSLQVWAPWPTAEYYDDAPDGEMVGYYQAGSWARFRVEVENIAALPELSFGPLDAIWQVPDHGPLDEFPSPADLQPHIDKLQEMAKAMTKVADLGNETRTAYRLQQVAVALWLGIDPVKVIDGMRFEGVGGSVYGVIEYRADVAHGHVMPARRQAECQADSLNGTATYRVPLSDDEGAALFRIVGAPIPRPFPTFGKGKP